MSNDDSSFGKTVRRLREAKRIGLRKFAQTVGMSPTYLSKVERGEFRPPSEEKIKAIALALGEDSNGLLALAGRVSTDLADIVQRQIQRHPREAADFLRSVNGLSATELEHLAQEARRLKNGERT